MAFVIELTMGVLRISMLPGPGKASGLVDYHTVAPQMSSKEDVLSVM
jgi:hypothetical protein